LIFLGASFDLVSNLPPGIDTVREAIDFIKGVNKV